MNIINESSGPRRFPHDLQTRIAVAKRIQSSGWSVKKAVSYYHVSRASAWRWAKRYDGTEESLKDKSHGTKTPCAFKTPEATRKKIKNLYDQRGKTNASSVDIWVSIKKGGTEISYSTVLRILKALEGYAKYTTNAKKRRRNGHYDTPTEVGSKWQMDVKYVPTECKAPGLEGKFYQYTILDEASRKRFLYFSDEHSMYEAEKAFRAAVKFFGYAPKILQTDNGSEFSDKAFKKEKSRYGRDYPNVLEPTLALYGVEHKFIRPRTPEHNGKVERSHRVDQEKFYRTLSFYSLDDLRKQGKNWNSRYNNTPRMVLKLKTPNQVELESLRRIMDNTGEVRCLKLFKCFTSTDN